MRLHDRKKTSPPVKDTLGKCATAAAGALLAMATGETTDAWKWYTLACALVVSEVSRNVQQTKLPFIGASLLTLPFALLYPGIVVETGTPLAAAIASVLTAIGWRDRRRRSQKKRQREQRNRK